MKTTHKMTILAALSLVVGTGCAHRTSTIARAAKTIELTETRREEVAELLGAPGGVVELRNHNLGCRERWSYSGLREQDREEVMFVDFDGNGRVCDVAYGHTTTASLVR